MAKLYLTILILLLSRCALFGGVVNAPNTYCVIVGVEKYAHNPLHYTVDDARKFKRWLKSPAGGGVPEDNFTTRLDEMATVSNIRAAILNTFAKMGPDDRFIFYFGGHGSMDGLAVYTPALSIRTSDGFLPYKQLREWLNSKKVGVVMVFIDACGSGGFAMDDHRYSSQNNFNTVVRYVASPTIVFAASRAHENAIEQSGASWNSYAGYTYYGGGLFTSYLMEGLTGAADYNEDKQITVKELAYYTQTNVQNATLNRGRQHPTLCVSDSSLYNHVLGVPTGRLFIPEPITSPLYSTNGEEITVPIDNRPPELSLEERQNLSDYFLASATDAYNANNYNEAIRFISKAITYDVQLNHYLSLFKGMCYQKLERYAESIQDFNTTINYSPNYKDAYLFRAISYAEMNDFYSAINDMKSVISLAPTDAFAYGYRAYLYYKGFNDYNKAEQDISKAIVIKPGDADYHYLRATLRIANKDFNKACEDLHVIQRLAYEDKDKILALISEYCETYNAPLATGTLSFWSDFASGGNISVWLNGQKMGELAFYLTETPDPNYCDYDGMLTFQNLPIGHYRVYARDVAGNNWSFIADVKKNTCTLRGLCCKDCDYYPAYYEKPPTQVLISTNDVSNSTSNSVSINNNVSSSSSTSSTYSSSNGTSYSQVTTNGHTVIKVNGKVVYEGPLENAPQGRWNYSAPTTYATANGGRAGSGTVIRQNSSINVGAMVGANCDVGSGCIIESGASVGANCDIGSGTVIKSSVSIGSNATIGSSVIINGPSTIGSNIDIGSSVVIKSNVTIGSNVSIGSSVIINSNVMLGSNCNIRSGSIVPSGTRLPANSVYP